ncbi:LPS assembly lipoprotein LptE [Dongia rigui]|uniref:LPS assembly lipoprotein LptE n=1 Tax=Dongia rigui TaxID=940149 RepID=A0ABU5DXV3_9PROT|nr:LPS assembly lipoprotein LptE [Dongia rigui]MDY0872144.1 LPS assembly lipoprotein LptE [Dongia rigui]
MSWSRRDVIRLGIGGFALAASGPLLSACGWKPLYGNASAGPSGNATVDANLAGIAIKEPFFERDAAPFGEFSEAGSAKYDARTAQILHNALRDGMNPYGQPAAPAYTLAIKLSESINRTLTADEGDARRENLTLRASFLLADLKGTELLKDKARSIIAYTVLQDPYTDLEARNDARDRTARQLAEQIKLRISSYFATHG